MPNAGILTIQLIYIQLTFADFVSDVKTTEPRMNPVT